MGFNKRYKLMEKTKKVALCGPSGSGKTTMAKHIASKLNIPYTENSAGLLLSQEDQQFLIDNYGWKKNGHAGVIQLTNTNPAFGWEFQTRLLKTRFKFIKETPQFVIDRSPIDNVAYFLLQNGHLTNQALTKNFIEVAQEAAKEITHLIFIPTMLTGEVEDNGSRIPNYYYQKMVTSVFAHVIHEYFSFIPHVELITSNFSVRANMVENFLRG